jgi:hypothetical protein
MSEVYVFSYPFPEGSAMNQLEESTTYQAILWKGRLTEARRFLVLVGEKKLGKLSEPAMAAIYGMIDIHELEQLGARLFEVDSWETLLGLPPRRRRSGRRQGNV